MAELKPHLRGPWLVDPHFEGHQPIAGYEARTRHWFEVLDLLEKALRAGAVEVRIRPVKP